MRCSCGHNIHPSELVQPYYDPSGAKLSIIWKCARCRSKKSRSFSLRSCNFSKGTPLDTLYKHIVHTMFIVDTESPDEQVRLERLPPITANEIAEVRGILKNDRIMIILGK